MHMFRDVFARRARAEIICVQESERVGELDACVDLPGYRILKSFAANGVCSFYLRRALFEARAPDLHIQVLAINGV